MCLAPSLYCDMRSLGLSAVLPTNMGKLSRDLDTPLNFICLTSKLCHYVASALEVPHLFSKLLGVVFCTYRMSIKFNSPAR